METTTFVKHFAAQFDETDPQTIQDSTEFRSIEEWSSMLALSIIAMADEEYGVIITGEDIRNSKTVNDIYQAILSKK